MGSTELKNEKTKTVLNQWLNRKKSNKPKRGIQPKPEIVPAPLSYGQQRIWLLQKLYPDNAFYHYAHTYRFKGKLNIELLQESFQRIMERHHSLRTTFDIHQDQIVQNINSVTTIDFTAVDLRHLATDQREEETRRIAVQEAQRPFDLSKGPLIRAKILKLEETDQILVLTLHHIIGDRLSLHILHDELIQFYQALAARKQIFFPPLPIQYTDYAYWQKSQNSDNGHLKYWLKQLAGELPVLKLPADFSRPATPSFKGGHNSKIYSVELSDKLRKLCQQTESTLFALLLSAFKVLLYRYSGQTDILVGTPHSNRDQVVLEKLIGFFNETVVLRSNLNDDPGFLELLKQVKETTLDALLHKNTPFELLVQELKPEREQSVNPIFQTMFIYNEAMPALSFGDRISLEESTLDLGVAKFDLTLFINDDGERLTASFEYASDIYKPATIERMQGHLENLLESIIKSPEQKISMLPILSPAERQQILKTWNETKTVIPEAPNIHSLIEQKAVETPDQTAVVFERETLSYQQLNEKANAVAAYLQSNGVKPNQSVGLFTERSLDMITGILGILKSGGAYLPLDPEYPAQRIEYVLKDAAVEIVLTQSNLVSLLPDVEVNALIIQDAIENANVETEDFQQVAQKDDLAYMIYTSGSSGNPKGVPITHRNLLYSTLARFDFYSAQPDAFLLLSSFSFDSSVVGIFWTLCNGGTLVIPKNRIEQDVKELANIILEHQVTHTLLLPSLYNVLLKTMDSRSLSSLNTVMVAGEACSSALVHQHFQTLPNVALYNEYGPTEATVWCTAHQITIEDTESSVPIGRPIPNVENYILDKNLQPVPVGVAGDLYVGGEGVAQGYWKRPELSVRKFIPHPFTDDSTKRLYKTGDLARYRANGCIDFIGRADHQVKIRGYRIELDEIEKVLLQEPDISDAIVIVRQVQDSQNESARGSDNQQLIAYVLGAEEKSIVDIRNSMKKQLPAYMVPVFIIKLDQFPRLPNGKIHIKALPDPDKISSTESTEIAEPRTPAEKKLVELWEEVMDIKPIGIHDNFFDIGGNSILSIQITAKIANAGYEINPNQLFNHQTIAELAAVISRSEEVVTTSIQDDFDEKEFPLTDLQQAFLFQSLQQDKDSGFLQLQFSLKGQLELERFQTAWQYAIRQHEVLRTSIQYKERESAVNSVQEEADMPWTIYDWRPFNEPAQLEKLSAFKEKDNNEPLDLSRAPISRMALIQTQNDQYWLIWTIHHILIDGWSGGVILKDALSFYSMLMEGPTIKVQPLPSYASYLNWQQGQDLTKAEVFWQKNLKDFKEPLLVPDGNNTNSSNFIQFSDYSFFASTDLSNSLRSCARRHRITLPVLLEGLYGILLCKYFQKQDAVLGTTVSGRFSAFKDLERMSGLFMNVLPLRTRLKFDQTLSDWLKDLQTQQLEALEAEYISLDQINSWAGWPTHLELFNCLFVFGNFLKDGLQIGNVEVENFSGDFSSNYPLTIRVNPFEALQFDIRFDENRLSLAEIKWLHTQFLLLLERISLNFEENISLVYASIPDPAFIPKSLKPIEKSSIISEKTNIEYIAPRNNLEFQLSKIWEEVFGHSQISINDNFFEMGGRSFQAIRIFSIIERDLGINLSPVALLEYPTIESLTIRMDNKEVKEHWSSIVPIKSSEAGLPLFCLHAGGAHVLFYKAMADRLERPVYAIQALGLDGNGRNYESIETMAKAYIEDMRAVQPKGPYALLGTCFGNAVALEMANQLTNSGEEIALLAIIDSGPAHLFSLKLTEKKQPLRNFLAMIFKGNWKVLRQRIKRRIYKPKEEASKLETAQERHLRETIAYLNNLYVAYTWTPFNGKITFIRSEEFEKLKSKDFHVEQWTVLAKQGLNIYVIPGHHKTLFEEPEVQGMAEIVEKTLKTEQKK